MKNKIISQAENSSPQGLSISAVLNSVMPRCFYSASQPRKKWLGFQITTFWDDLVALRVREKSFQNDFIKIRAWNKGFTLIELLVVVLIIGILSAVALPQYQKAVWKSRAATMLHNLRALASAQELYYIANGEYATRFGDVDLSFDSLPNKPASSLLATSSSDAVRSNDYYELVVNVVSAFSFSSALIINGPYKGAGFTIPHQPNLSQLQKGKIYCTESRLFPVANNFCKQFYGGEKVISAYNSYFYSIP